MKKPFSPKSGDPKRDDLKRWASERYAEAQALRSVRLSEGAVYLLGQAVELALKAAICRHLSEDQLVEEFKIHDLEALRFLAGLRASMELDRSPRIRQGFSELCARWRSGLNRYEAGVAPADVEALFKLVENPTEGVWPWLVAKS